MRPRGQVARPTGRRALRAAALAAAALAFFVLLRAATRAGPEPVQEPDRPGATEVGSAFAEAVSLSSAARKAASLRDGASRPSDAALGAPWVAGQVTDPAHVPRVTADAFVASSGHARPQEVVVAAGREALAADVGLPPSRRGDRGAGADAGTGLTLVAYVYNPRERAQEESWDFFRRFGIRTHPGVTYRVLLPAASSGVRVPAAADRPALDEGAGAAYLETSAPCASVWGVLRAALDGNNGAGSFHDMWHRAEIVVVVDASARGPFVPVYLERAGAHWTQAFSSLLRGGPHDPWMTGSAITCEGAPRGGDASAPWRRNPYLLPYAWAVDRRGARALASDYAAMRCHSDPWSERHDGDAGASLAILARGGGLDTLLARYQGVRWRDPSTWGCNGRVRPDVELAYDGASISPYEVMFVPFDSAKLALRWSHVTTAERYSRWMTARDDAVSGDARARAAAAKALSSNEWIERAVDVRAERMVYMNARGPGCFDLRYYIQHNPDLASIQDPMAIWEHWVLLGQFQGRTHRFSCPVQLGVSYRIAYLRARGHACFDHAFYLEHSPDLKADGFSSAADLFGHYAFFGQFEGRLTRYTCPDTMWNFTAGFDGLAIDDRGTGTNDPGTTQLDGHGLTEVAVDGEALPILPGVGTTIGGVPAVARKNATSSTGGGVGGAAATDAATAAGKASSG